MRIINRKNFPWFAFVCLATIGAILLYVGNFHPDRMPAGIRLPTSLIQVPTEHHTVGGTPLGLAFGAISLAIFIFAALLSLRKKIPLWRIGTAERWLRAHIWLTLLTIPLVILHSGFRFGGPMTTLLIGLYSVVMVSGIYGLVLQHIMPRVMKERLPAETVFEQIPHIRAQLCLAAGKMRDSLKPVPLKQPDAAPISRNPGKAAMASSKGELSTPTARAKPVTASATVVEPPEEVPANADAKSVKAPVESAGGSVANAAPPAASSKSSETVGAGEVQRKSETPAGPINPETAPNIGSASGVPAPDAPKNATSTSPRQESGTLEKGTPASVASAKPLTAKPPVAKPAVSSAKASLPSDPASEAVLVEFIDRQVLPYLGARRGERFPFGSVRFSDDTFRLLKLRVAEPYRSRVEEIQNWCDERRLLDLQTRLQHWLHGWLLIHVPFSFLLLILTIWHAYVTLFYY